MPFMANNHVRLRHLETYLSNQEGRLPTQRRFIVELFRDSDEPMTCVTVLAEMLEAGYDVGLPLVSAKISELRGEGLLGDSGERGRGVSNHPATKWCLTREPREEDFIKTSRRQNPRRISPMWRQTRH